MYHQQVLDLLEQIAKILGVVVALVSAAIVWCEYTANQNNERINRTLQFSEAYRSGSFLETRKELHKTVDRAIYDKTGSQRDWDEYAEALVAMLDRGEPFISYEIVLESFDELMRCTITEVCDVKTATDLFAEEACFLVTVLFPAIEGRIKTTHAEHASGLRYFADKYIENGTKPCVAVSALNG